MIRIALENSFRRCELPGGTEIEIVIDRYISNEKEEEELKDYLRGNYKLPPILHLNQVDSAYCDPIQITDLAGKLAKARVEGENDGRQIGITAIRIDDPFKPVVSVI